MPRIPIIKTKFPSQAYMQTKGPRVGSTHRFRYGPGRDGYMHLMKGPDGLWWETKYEPLQGPELPRDIEKYRQQMIDAIESGNDRRKLSRMRAYENAVAEDLARQAYNRERMAQAVKMRKRELWQNYLEDEDPPPGIGWSEERAELFDEELEKMANGDVRGWPDPNERPGSPDWDFREYYKNAPWRMW